MTKPRDAMTANKANTEPTSDDDDEGEDAEHYKILKTSTLDVLIGHRVGEKKQLLRPLASHANQAFNQSVYRSFTPSKTGTEARIWVALLIKMKDRKGFLFWQEAQTSKARIYKVKEEHEAPLRKGVDEEEFFGVTRSSSSTKRYFSSTVNQALKRYREALPSEEVELSAEAISNGEIRDDEKSLELVIKIWDQEFKRVECNLTEEASKRKVDETAKARKKESLQPIEKNPRSSSLNPRLRSMGVLAAEVDLTSTSTSTSSSTKATRKHKPSDPQDNSLRRGSIDGGVIIGNGISDIKSSGSSSVSGGEKGGERLETDTFTSTSTSASSSTSNNEARKGRTIDMNPLQANDDFAKNECHEHSNFDSTGEFGADEEEEQVKIEVDDVGLVAFDGGNDEHWEDNDVGATNLSFTFSPSDSSEVEGSVASLSSTINEKAISAQAQGQGPAIPPLKEGVVKVADDAGKSKKKKKIVSDINNESKKVESGGIIDVELTPAIPIVESPILKIKMNEREHADISESSSSASVSTSTFCGGVMGVGGDADERTEKKRIDIVEKKQQKKNKNKNTGFVSSESKDSGDADSEVVEVSRTSAASVSVSKIKKTDHKSKQKHAILSTSNAVTTSSKVETSSSSSSSVGSKKRKKASADHSEELDAAAADDDDDISTRSKKLMEFFKLASKISKSTSFNESEGAQRKRQKTSDDDDDTRGGYLLLIFQQG